MRRSRRALLASIEPVMFIPRRKPGQQVPSPHDHLMISLSRAVGTGSTPTTATPGREKKAH